MFLNQALCDLCRCNIYDLHKMTVMEAGATDNNFEHQSSSKNLEYPHTNQFIHLFWVLFEYPQHMLWFRNKKKYFSITHTLIFRSMTTYKLCTVTPVLSDHSKKESLMKVESIAECSFGAFCNTFDLH